MKHLLCLLCILFAGACATPSGSDRGTGPLTPGMVKLKIVKGQTTQATVLETFGPPDQVTHRDDKQIWTYDKIHYDTRVDSGTLILYSASSERSASTSTLLILYFGANDVVYDYRLDTFKYWTEVLMKSVIAAAWALVLASVLTGCSTNNIAKFSQAQLTAMTTREVDAPVDPTFKAAIDALFDAGYTIGTSDRQGGILTGIRGKDQSAARVWVSPMIRDDQYKISVLFREISARTTTVRLSMSLNDEPYVNEKSIDEFWRLMKRQVMMTDPPPVEPPPKQ